MNATVTERARNRTSGRVEMWTVSFPGGWTAARREDTGTTWDLALAGHPGVLTHLPSVERIAELIASSEALAALDRQVADAARARCGWRSPWGTGSCCSELAVPGSSRCDRHGVAA